MSAQIINGKEIAESVRQEISKEVQQLREKNVVPGLAVILVGDNQASQTYVRHKQKACEDLGMHSVLIKKPAELSQEELIQSIAELNQDDSIHGILVQLPLPGHIQEKAIIEAISPEKDVDGFHPINIGRMMTGQDAFLPCTPYGVMVMLEYIDYDLEGKHVVIVGRSNIVGKPAGQLFLNANATVTYCHSRTKDLAYYTKQADVVVAAVGKRDTITSDHIKEGAIVIDVGMNRNDEGKLCGDVAFDEVKNKASYITPVPKGVGPMTITMLMKNTVKSAQKALESNKQALKS
ncbi:bifunctional methylenetetrahydrofolate dehydrogenase/methenyltetrahydrofolate cyclohydrolase FolD [Peribacillus frigoritolerans]|jgi:methylenetetrahydrofolate dehydrogenase (NADP+)/methenyltetrahydrofolate cyclohydrolase|uniref:bifunctional methylenetetrahydrofolate dehydrogenase/methenyltetrahydrofolate cyclohydrolase FolD n=1 Tax=Peribacillus TaxID=2675229 RepID=UPI0006AC7B33|nr:bifunctional methylenetetrahydrofolate dehydrogenase/methenyltetrahydrofolate cyclohydrolase FolD [Peribacillus frigoritolerans]KOR79626.1 5,10-methylene-tetrahydrofolate cyclohydrolase [Bacillus sp. FJAT-21352]KOR86693.1 5,10-methylene-tetrahydrofolate cyclohydrolase [Bacillus sp. FJAT-22058]AZV63603.1 bifunctional methylenetetrahydrofolate dehydrogenase/methenyltetrahydrofolate cyclohydrolase FolD [Peribacillus frigoritolerans]MCY9141289.1 bifunctional methylenetetrahydrofolate dehydrogena